MKEERFWNWFLANAKAIKLWINTNDSDYKLYNTLTEQLWEYSENLIPELTVDKNGNAVLIISCDGIKAGIQPVLQLYNAAPPVKGWVIQKFRAPGYVNSVTFEGLALAPDDIRIKFIFNGPVADVEIYMKGYNDNDSRYKSLGFLYLDHFIGEYAAMTRIGQISFKKPSWFNRSKGTVTLQEFSNLLNNNN
ncbi:MAG TPA: hypothetical protein VG738_13790 [Chitinophagaceae bacterium]|nr:hypothetical protein [Chitinophagaceae bacterium]